MLCEGVLFVKLRKKKWLFEVLWGRYVFQVLVIPSFALNLVRKAEIQSKARNDKGLRTP